MSELDRCTSRRRRDYRYLSPLGRLGALAIFLFAASSCDTKTYRVELTPKGDKIERTLTISRRERDLADQERSELGRIARLYGAQAPRLPAKSAQFNGTFSNILPKDIGGDGHFAHWDSPLGRVCVYVERFRGNDDVQGSLESERKAVDELVDLLVGWFEFELHGSPDWPALRGFLDKSFREDVQNLRLYAWALTIDNVSDSKALDAEIGFRAAQYFVERGYFTYEEAPALLRALTALLQRGDTARLLAIIRRFPAFHSITHSGGRPADSLGFLSDPQRASASWHRYFEQTEYFKQHKAQAAHPDRGPQEKPNAPAAPTKSNRERADDVLTELSQKAFPILDLHLFGESNQLELSLAAIREPFWTNGKWVAGGRRVAWSKQIPALTNPGDPFDRDWPRMCFAAWDEPNEEAQARLLGSARVTSENLFEYCLWYQGLSRQEQQEWNAFLPTSRNEKPPFKSLDEFRFSDEPATNSGSERVAFPGVNVIKNALEPRKP